MGRLTKNAILYSRMSYGWMEVNAWVESKRLRGRNGNTAVHLDEHIGKRVHSAYYLHPTKRVDVDTFFLLFVLLLYRRAVVLYSY